MAGHSPWANIKHRKAAVDAKRGKLGGTNCVAWMFERKGLLLIPAGKVDEERLMEVVLDAGADDLKREGDTFQVTSPPEAFNAVSEALAKAGIEPDSKQLTRVPS